MTTHAIFRYTEGPFNWLFPKRRNEIQLMYNTMHIVAYTMIEHVIGREKTYLAIIGNIYTFDLKWI